MPFELSDIIHIAKDDLKLTCREPLDETLFELLTEQVRNGVVVKVMAPEKQRGSFTKNPFLLNKSITFVNEGGRLYVSDLELQDQMIVDFKEYYFFDEVAQQGEARNLDRQLQGFSKLVATSSAFLEESDEISLDLSASSYHIKRGEEITLSWQASKAIKVVIQGVGEVSTEGSHRLRPLENTIFKIAATDEVQTRLESVIVRVGEDVKMSYELSFLNRYGGKFSALSAKGDSAHVYGLAQGTRVRLRWQSTNCDQVTIEPLGLDAINGSHEFVTEESMELKMVGNRGDHVYLKKIKLLVFPMAVHTQHLSKVLPEIMAKATTSIASSLSDKIAAYQRDHSRLVEKVSRYEEERFQKLLQKIPRSKMDKDLDLTFTNLEVLKKLKKKYTRKGFGQVIDSIKNYYGARS